MNFFSRLLILPIAFANCSQLLSKCGATPIRSLPFTITSSGRYCLFQDLTYNGADAAITVNANDVTINLSNHRITVNRASASGIKIDGKNAVTVANGTIIRSSSAANPNSMGINAINGRKLIVRNVNLLNFFDGIHLGNWNDSIVNNAEVLNAVNSGLYSIGSKYLRVTNTKIFNSLLDGITLDSNNNDVIIASSQVETNNATGIALFARDVNNLIVNNSNFEAKSENAAVNVAQFGSVASDANAHNVVVNNCNFRGAGVAGFDGVYFLAGSNAIFQNSTIIANAPPLPVSVDNPSGYQNGALHVNSTIPAFGSTSNKLFESLKVQNCVIKNTLSNGIVVEPVLLNLSPNRTNVITISDSLISNSSRGILLLGAIGTVIKNNEIRNNANEGILLTSDSIITFPSINNIIKDNALSDNTNGISLATNSNNNLIEHNKLVSNSGTGLLNAGTNNQAFYNEARNNGTNYVGVSFIVPPGNPAITGGNIDS